MFPPAIRESGTRKQREVPLPGLLTEVARIATGGAVVSSVPVTSLLTVPSPAPPPGLPFLGRCRIDEIGTMVLEYPLQ